MNRLSSAFSAAALLILSFGLHGCAMLGIKTSKVSNDDLAKEFYSAQIETLTALDQAFLRIGQEYFTIEQEYINMGKPELAQLTRKKAELFHQQHIEFQNKTLELKAKQARVLRGESPTPDDSATASDQPTAPQRKPAAKPAPQPPAPAPAPPKKPAPAPQAPARTLPPPPPAR